MPDTVLQRGCGWVAVGAALLGGMIASGNVRADFYVSPVGSDGNAGTESAPFATLEAARDAFRKTRGSSAGPITVWLRGGDYRRTRSFELSLEDSGTESSPVAWRGYPGERARLLGGTPLPAFRPLTDPAVLKRLDESARGKVVAFDLRPLGMADFGDLKSRGFGRSTEPAHSELFFDGRPMTLARWPDEGRFTRIAGFPAAAGKGDDHGGKIGDLSRGFNYEGDRPARWAASSNIWVHGYWAWDWANSYERVAGLDTATRLIQTAPPHGLYGFRQGQRFYFLNVLEELDQPGEWFLDRSSQTLYFWPPEPARQSAPPEAVLSLLAQPLIKLTEVSNVTIRGLVLEATRGNAVEIRGGANDRIAGCTMQNIGDNAVVIEGGFGHGVVSCDIFDTGDGGVAMTGGDRQTLTPGGHFVENCHFQRQGRWSKCYVPAIHLQGVGLRASHNLIHDHPHCAILFWGNDHLMEFNDIHHIALETGDVGAIYTGRDYTFRGNRIRHNFIHETGGVGMGSMGVYMDDCVSGTEVFGNIFYQVHWAMFIGGGRDHRVENNLFVDCDPAVRVDARGLDASPVWREMVNGTMRQRMADVPLALYRQHYPAMKDLDLYYGPPDGPAITGDAFKGVPASGNVIALNVCQGKWLEAGWHASEAGLELRDNYSGSDVGLANAAQHDFAIRADSPAWKTGFQPLPLTDIGLRNDDLRRELNSSINLSTP